ncbi:MAG: DUF4861 family protein, partial [Woeseiaceae bacterium]
MFAATALAACNAPPEEAALPAAPDDVLARIDLSNPSEFARRDAVTTLDLDVLGLAADGPADFGPAERTTVEIVAGEPSVPPKRTQAEVSIKEGGEFVNVDAVRPPPQYTDHSEYIRYEGPGIESDKVGYRVYLDWRNGFDVFGKTTDAMVLQDVGLDGYDSYHEPADWGLDILKVGDAVGIGGYGFWDG